MYNNYSFRNWLSTPPLHILLLIMYLTCLAPSVDAQTSTCSAIQVLNRQLQADTSLLGRMQQIEIQTQNFVSGRQSSPSTTITIPVVFHVIYKNAAENISDAKILSQLAVLNQDFNQMNPNLGNVPIPFRNLVADTEIKFCLAQRTVCGSATNGIERRANNSTTAFGTNDLIKYSINGGLDAWDATQYLNIWIFDVGGNSSGYPQFPGGSLLTDGVVIDYRYCGEMNNGTSYNLGRKTTHNVAHWLNLRHIFGDANCGNDLVADTPPQAAANLGCPTFPQVTCGNGPNGDLFMNFMDYTDDNCMSMFTNGQKARMRAVLAPSGFRGGLLGSQGCSPPIVATNSISITTTTTYNCDNTANIIFTINPVSAINQIAGSTIDLGFFSLAPIINLQNGVATYTLNNIQIWNGRTLPVIFTPACGVVLSQPIPDVVLLNQVESFTVSLDVDDPTPPAGGMVTMILRLDNTGNTTVDVNLSDIVPANLTYCGAVSPFPAVAHLVPSGAPYILFIPMCVADRCNQPTMQYSIQSNSRCRFVTTNVNISPQNRISVSTLGISTTTNVLCENTTAYIDFDMNFISNLSNTNLRVVINNINIIGANLNGFTPPLIFNLNSTSNSTAHFPLNITSSGAVGTPINITFDVHYDDGNGGCINVDDQIDISNILISNCVITPSCPQTCPNIFVVSQGATQNLSDFPVLAGASGNPLAGQCLNIGGKFVVDQNWSLDNCTFTMEPGAEIIIKSGFEMSVQNCTYSGCKAMWKGITVGGGSKLSIFKSKIEDALYAIEVDETGFLQDAEENLFVNNYIGIYIPPIFLSRPQDLGLPNQGILNNKFWGERKLLPEYPGQTTIINNLPLPARSHGYSFAGIFANNVENLLVTSNIAAPDNFRTMFFGVIAYNCVQVDVQNCGFLSITGYFDHSYYDNTYSFSGTPVAILTNNTQNETVTHCEFQKVSTGISATQANHLNVTDNIISCVVENIRYSNYLVGTDCTIGNNIINSRGSGRLGITVQEFATNGENTGLFDAVRNNEFLSFNSENINMYGLKSKLVVEGNQMLLGHNGTYTPIPNQGFITLNNCIGRARVSNNYVGVAGSWICNPIPVSPPPICYLEYPYAIAVDGGRATQVRNNTIEFVRQGDQSLSRPGLRQGITFTNSTDNWVCGNTVSLADNAMQFMGSCATGINSLTTKVKGNALVGKGIGLYLLNGAEIGIQDHVLNTYRGSTWDASAETDPAHFANPQLSLFRLKNDAFYNVNTPDFFSYLTTGTNIGCTLTNEPINPLIGTGGGTGLIVADDVNTAKGLLAIDNQFGKGILWSKQQQLLTKLNTYPNLVNQNGSVADFYAQASTNTLGKFDKIAQGTDNLMFRDNATMRLYYSWDTIANVKFRKIVLIDSQLVKPNANVPVLLAQKQQLINELKPINTQMQRLITSLKVGMTERLQGLIEQNNNIKCDEVYECNEQIINSIYLNTFLVSGNLNFNDADKKLIDGIANQCPLTGGDVVFKARTLQNFYRQVYYNNQDLCNAKPPKTKHVSVKEMGSKIYPNPTDDSFNLTLEHPAKKDTELVLFDLIGKEVLRQKIPEGDTRMQISLEGIPKGMYICFVHQGFVQLLTEKLFVIKE
jgi:Pregnancy-associated plasma protein-A/Secretion system C-terminal sorting domain